jgi:protein-S-isoprenylcysteine O-methyltransferase Ste14
MNLSSQPPRAVSPPSAFTIATAWGGALLFTAALGYFLYAFLVRFGRPAAAGPVTGPILIDLALFSVFALHHSLFARPPLKALVHRFIPQVLERSFYTWVASALLISTCWWWQPVPGVLYVLPPGLAEIGFAVQAVGIYFTFAGSRAIDVLDLAGVRTVLLARASRPATHVPLMTAGVYGFVRHPLYFGWALLVFGPPTMTATRMVFAAASTAYLAIAIPWEENSLIGTFGDDYRAYRARVRWRMLPFIY